MHILILCIHLVTNVSLLYSIYKFNGHSDMVHPFNVNVSFFILHIHIDGHFDMTQPFNAEVFPFYYRYTF